MAFWPIAVFTLIYSDFSGLWDTAIILLLGFGGAVTFIILRNTKRAIRAARQEKRVRTRNRRSGTYSEKLESLKALGKAILSLLPDNRVMEALVAIGVFANIGFGFHFLMRLWGDITASSSPSVVMVGLFVLPILYLMVVSVAIFW